MKKIPTLFQGDDISVQLTYGTACSDIVLYGVNGTEFTNQFTEPFGSGITITSVVGKLLINNIVKNNTPTITVTGNAILFIIARAITKLYEKGLLEVELLLTLDDNGTEKHIVKRLPIGWIKEAYTITL